MYYNAELGPASNLKLAACRLGVTLARDRVGHSCHCQGAFTWAPAFDLGFSCDVGQAATLIKQGESYALSR